MVDQPNPTELTSDDLAASLASIDARLASIEGMINGIDDQIEHLRDRHHARLAAIEAQLAAIIEQLGLAAPPVQNCPKLSETVRTPPPGSSPRRF